MARVEFTPRGVCSRKITVETEDGLVKDVQFVGGCDGNLKAISKLVSGMPAEQVIQLLEGNTCGPRSTSCADQLTKAVKESL